MKSIKTWILLADARMARIVENPGPGKGVFQIRNKVFEAKEVNEFADSAGRTHNSTTSTRHKYETPDNTSNAANEFVDEILTSLQKSLRDGEYNRLIICAAPKTLGLINKALPKSLKDVTIGQVDRDLTRVPTDKLAKHFETLIMV